MKTKVSIVRCDSYEPVRLKQAAHNAFELLGGLSTFIKKGERVVLKPNLLSAGSPERVVTTNVEVVRTVAKLVKECGAIPLIGDNPGGSVTPRNAYEGSGFSRMAKEEGVELLEVKNIKMVSGIPIASYFFECDKIISLPKMKTHSLMILTGAVKNMYGAVSGLNKTEYHKRFPRPDQFVDVLIDVYKAVRPCVSLMDGIIAMHGDGPASGDIKQVGLLMASQDSVALDAVFSHLIGIKPFDILTTKLAHEKGLGNGDIKEIEIVGEKIESCLIRGFKLPSSSIIMKIPEPFMSTLASLIRFGPFIVEKLCKKCMICAESCPVVAITVNERESVIDSRKCIRCMCCHEVCPHQAVILRRNFLAKVFGL